MGTASAEELGTVGNLIFDSSLRRVGAVAVGRGRKATIVEWHAVSGFGPDAVMVAADAALRSPANDQERFAAGKLDPVGKRVLSAQGNELGVVDDVTFDTETGSVHELLAGDREISATAILGCGTYAVVLEATQDPNPSAPPSTAR
ncbi:MAG TPA: PRC-barrel domain-containing protein [Acidimicrobiales bacterium]|nr:PRC-barrel domain-containing protein [Acidimicrobiales bacterium]